MKLPTSRHIVTDLNHRMPMRPKMAALSYLNKLERDLKRSAARQKPPLSTYETTVYPAMIEQPGGRRSVLSGPDICLGANT